MNCPALILAIAAALAANEYQATGLIVNVDRARQAMVMPFHVRDAKLLNGLQPGNMVDFTLVVDSHGSYLQDIRIRPFESGEVDPLQANRLKFLNSAMAGAAAVPVLKPGDLVPDFELIDQDRRSVRLSQFAGKVVALTFIYTRCPLPDYCFRLSNNFGVLQKRFQDRMGQDLVLLSITFDPVRDQPNALAKYAHTWQANSASWRFLTGPLPDIRNICARFDMNFWPDEGTLTHSLHTVVIDRGGRMVANIEGNQFSAEQLGDLVNAVMTR